MKKIVSLVAVVPIVAVVFLSFAGCGPTQTPPSTPAPAGMPTSLACPVLPPMFRTGCPGADLTAMTLTCAGGAPTITTGPIPPPSGGTRVGVVLPNGSTIKTTVNAVSPNLTGPCVAVTPSNTITIMFGVAYVGDLGSVAAAPGVTAIPFCISRSKANFTQFATGDPLATVFQDPLKAQIHLEIDRAVIQTLSGAAAPTPRCPFWRQMP